MLNYWYEPYSPFLRKSYKKNLAKYENNLEFQIQFNRGVNIHMDEFIWNGLPDTCDEETIERQLIFRGAAGFYKHPSTDAIIALGAGLGGKINMNGRPTTAFLYGWDGTHFESEIYWPQTDNTDARCVIIADNKTYFPPVYSIELGAKRIAEAKRNLDTAAKNAKYPCIIYCTEEQKRAILDLYDKVQENQPLILIAKGNDITEDKTGTFSTDVKEGILKELWDYYTNTKNDVFNDWGVNMNQNNDKKERMTITEVEGNTDFVKIVNGYRLRKRQEAAENANKLFGTNISVEYRYIDEEHDPEVVEQIEEAENVTNEETIQNN